MKTQNAECYGDTAAICADNVMGDAAKQLRRPQDEKYETVESLFAHLKKVSEFSKEEVLARPEFDLVGQGSARQRIELNGHQLSAYAFEQLCSAHRIPAEFLLTLSDTLILNILKSRIEGRSSDLKILLDENDKVRAITSERYDRIWDYDFAVRTIGFIDDKFLAGGLYSGDRDTFVDFFNPDLVIEHKGEKLFPFLVAWNSEVGWLSAGAKAGWVRAKCMNHNYWGHRFLGEISIKHIGTGSLRKYGTALSFLKGQLLSFAAKADEIKSMLDRSMSLVVLDESRQDEDGLAPESVKTLGHKLRLPQRTVREAFRAAVERPENLGNFSPRSAWGMAQGLTSVAKEKPNRDLRFDLEQAAAILLK